MSTDTAPAANGESAAVIVHPASTIAVPASIPEVRRDATVMELAQVIADSRAFPECRSPAAAAVRILAGREMGVGPIASVIGIRVQAGRVSMDATLMAGVIERSDVYGYEIESLTNEGAKLRFFKGGKLIGESAFTIEDAKKAGLLCTKNETWHKYPRNMLFARALSNGARWYCPGIFGGSIYSHEELGYAVDDEGRAVGVESADAAGGSSASNDLCTREQRQRIAALQQQAGGTMQALLSEWGIRMLDELSGYEADKLIRKLERKTQKEAAKTTAETLRKEDAATNPQEPVKDIKESPAPDSTDHHATNGTAAGMMADAIDDIKKPCTRSQQMEIRALAETLEPDEDARYEMLVAALNRRKVSKIAELTAAQALSLIDGLRGKINAGGVKDAAPFDKSKAASAVTA